ncbi:hypothetical protein B0J13DRAFT_531516 [Dactylonectria estremocensis]|uniref:Uncharacterized protein n=1 Tax=Dactylonectria estremocensis TaxID=1079267 RepID=A0A9P9DQX0_9HYPO|nr:hypothetical protein B0J13DRAFT_531516 [Dactylonectria estremocensis]
MSLFCPDLDFNTPSPKIKTLIDLWDRNELNADEAQLWNKVVSLKNLDETFQSTMYRDKSTTYDSVWKKLWMLSMLHEELEAWNEVLTFRSHYLYRKLSADEVSTAFKMNFCLITQILPVQLTTRVTKKQPILGSEDFSDTPSWYREQFDAFCIRERERHEIQRKVGEEQLRKAFASYTFSSASAPSNGFASFGNRSVSMSSPGNGFASFGNRSVSMSSPGNGFASFGNRSVPASTPGNGFASFGNGSASGSSPSGNGVSASDLITKKSVSASAPFGNGFVSFGNGSTSGSSPSDNGVSASDLFTKKSVSASAPFGNGFVSFGNGSASGSSPSSNGSVSLAQNLPANTPSPSPLEDLASKVTGLLRNSKSTLADHAPSPTQLSSENGPSTSTGEPSG